MQFSLTRRKPPIYPARNPKYTSVPGSPDIPCTQPRLRNPRYILWCPIFEAHLIAFFRQGFQVFTKVREFSSPFYHRPPTTASSRGKKKYYDKSMSAINLIR